jgi:hypothetical protein
VLADTVRMCKLNNNSGAFYVMSSARLGLSEPEQPSILFWEDRPGSSVVGLTIADKATASINSAK